MNLAEWRAKQAGGEELTLPSGLDVKLKRVALIDLVQSGKIPQTLRAPVDEIMRMNEAAGNKMSIDDLQKFAGVVDLVAGACLVEPAELDIAELPWADRQAIFSWANAPADELVPFRRQQNGAVESAFTVS